MPVLITPNLYHLQGKGLEVSYSTVTEQPSLSYQDAQGLKSFKGGEIRVEKSTVLGTLVSVTLGTTHEKDLGGDTALTSLTSLTLIIPEIGTLGNSVPVETYCVTTTHYFGTRLHPRFGQFYKYSVTPVQGTAAKTP